MRRLALLFLLVGMAWPAYSVEPVTVAQLEIELAAAHGKRDAALAKRLSQLELTERLSTLRLAHWQAVLPGDKARQALIAVADASAFLDLPAKDIPEMEAPDRAAQDALLAKTDFYVGETISRLPNFFAKEDAIQFADRPANRSNSPDNGLSGRTLHVVDKHSAIVRYVGGQEELEAAAAKNNRPGSEQQLTTKGVFGTILGAVLDDAFRGSSAWSHWEQGTGGPIAVFSYVVPREKSHYAVYIPHDPEHLAKVTGYHGEIGVDLATGAILRLTMLADLKPTGPVRNADILVEYGPVEIAGVTYICPLRSIARSLARPFDVFRDVYGSSQRGRALMDFQLSDIAFRDYHLFRSEVRVLGEADADQDGNPQNR